MKYVKLGNTEIKVSTIAFGGWAIVGGANWGYQDKNDSINAIKTAFEEGITFFDTAELYGDGASEKLLAEALSSVRSDVVIASKVATQHFNQADMIHSCEQSLKYLKTDYLDLYQLHWPSRKHQIEETIANLELLKTQGKIREYGVSNFGKHDLTDALKITNNICSNQLAYNLLSRAIEYDILPKCIDNNISVLCYSPLMQGLLTGKFKNADDVPVERARTRHFSPTRRDARHESPGAEELTFETINKIISLAERLNVTIGDLALSWLLAQDGITSVIAGGRNPEQVKRNIKSVNTKLDNSVVSELSRITEPLKQELGANADLWQGKSRIN
jgi:myo-inositol catabolism protein IolS